MSTFRITLARPPAGDVVVLVHGLAAPNLGKHVETHAIGAFNRDGPLGAKRRIERPISIE